MIILGIHAGHDSSAAIIKDGIVLADVQEERFSRVKHSNNIPLKSIEYCLKIAKIENINDLDFISTSWENNSDELNTVFGLNKKEERKEKFLKKMANSFLGKSFGFDNLKLPIYYNNYKLSDSGKFINNNHHLAHAASAYFTRKSNSKCLIFVIDGAGDNMCTSIWLGEENNISLLKSYFKEASIGWAYSVVTEGLHWIHGDGEGKTMGLAPYGEQENVKGVLDKYFPVFDEDNQCKDGEAFFEVSI